MRTRRAFKTLVAAPIAIPVLIVGIVMVLMALLTRLSVDFLDSLMTKIDNWVEK